MDAKFQKQFETYSSVTDMFPMNEKFLSPARHEGKGVIGKVKVKRI